VPVFATAQDVQRSPSYQEYRAIRKAQAAITAARRRTAAFKGRGRATALDRLKDATQRALKDLDV